MALMQDKNVAACLVRNQQIFGQSRHSSGVKQPTILIHVQWVSLIQIGDICGISRRHELHHASPFIRIRFTGIYVKHFRCQAFSFQSTFKPERGINEVCGTNVASIVSFVSTGLETFLILQALLH